MARTGGVQPFDVSTHSRPKAADGGVFPFLVWLSVSTHSRPKAAVWIPSPVRGRNCFNTQPPEGG